MSVYTLVVHNLHKLYLNHFHGKTLLLVLVHVNDLVPVLSALAQAKRLTQVHQVQDVLLETRPTKPGNRVGMMLVSYILGKYVKTVQLIRPTPTSRVQKRMQ